MRTEKITCDGCGADLTGGTSMPGYRLVLESEPIPTSGGEVYGVMVYPHLTQGAYFCNMKCLGKWLKATLEAQP